MRKKLVNVTIIFISIISIITFLSFRKNDEEENNLSKGRQLIYINEIRKELEEDNVKNEALTKAINNLEQEVSLFDNSKSNNSYIFYEYIIIISFILIIFGYAYFAIVRPFEKMEKFAEEIGKGNFDIKVDYEKNNLFGAFTWSFDHMRREIIKARSCEREAIDNNKTVIATLSHDIKTPIASIRAYAEGLEAGLDYNVERRNKYINVIIRKCDEVTKLTNDLFLHSLSDLEMLKINTEEVEISELIKNSLKELIEEEKKVSIIGNMPKALLDVDVKRFNQVLENIINNSNKYAKDSKIEVRGEINKDNYVIKIKDFGEGIKDKDLPFIFNKFYRGENALEKQGSGLGLFIVKYIMNQLKGDVEVYNNNGLEVKLILPLKFKS
ncbi:MAG: HAMP domain-containing sensor histidine kinase [Clostridium sp.]|nr:HAMP domain-containing sensor histidine kinase [Clostridium sp.]